MERGDAGTPLSYHVLPASSSSQGTAGLGRLQIPPLTLAFWTDSALATAPAGQPVSPTTVKTREDRVKKPRKSKENT
jgi:hypothetical protein